MSYKLLFNTYNNIVDQYISRIHKFIYLKFAWQSVLISLSLYILIILLFSEFLRISCNYFVLLPLIASALAYGLYGGIVAGLLSLPMNLLLFLIIGHLEFGPDSLIIAFLFGIFVGLVLGYLSDYFRKLTNEVERRIKSENTLREILSEKELLLREVNHRVRNNLGIINSLIQLQSNRMNNPDFTKECDKLKQRILSISSVYEQLYLDNHALSLDINNYLESLVTNIINSLNEYDIEFIYTKPDYEILISSDRVLHLGLIVQEIVINSLKYAFSGDEKGQLRLTVNKDNEYINIEVRDSGNGFDPENVITGLGTRLIKSLSDSLGSCYSWNCDDGCVFTLKFPLTEIAK